MAALHISLTSVPDIASSRAGMTLVEMLMPLFVVAILVAVALPSIRVHLANSDIRRTADELKSGLEMARAEAIRLNTVVRFQRDGTGWTVVLPGVGASRDVVVDRRASRHSQVGVSADIDTLSFGTSGWTLPFGRSMNIALQAPDVAACRPQGGVVCLNVVVAADGLVRSCDPAATAGSPTACGLQQADASPRTARGGGH